jgi:hypothetical protein
MLMEKIKSETRRQKAAREYSEPGFQWTRRTIAILSILSIVVVPILAGWLTPEVFITYGWEETKNGFLFFGGGETMRWATGSGIVLAPFHTHLVAAIAGLYFGSSSVK